MDASEVPVEENLRQSQSGRLDNENLSGFLVDCWEFFFDAGKYAIALSLIHI